MSLHEVGDKKVGDGKGGGIKHLFHEVPIWVWGLIGVAGVYFIFLHKGKAALSTQSGTPIATDALNSTGGNANPALNPADPAAAWQGYLDMMNSQYSSQQEQLNQEQQLIQAQQQQTSDLMQQIQDFLAQGTAGQAGGLPGSSGGDGTPGLPPTTSPPGNTPSSPPDAQPPASDQGYQPNDSSYTPSDTATPTDAFAPPGFPVVDPNSPNYNPALIGPNSDPGSIAAAQAALARQVAPVAYTPPSTSSAPSQPGEVLNLSQTFPTPFGGPSTIVGPVMPTLAGIPTSVGATFGMMPTQPQPLEQQLGGVATNPLSRFGLYPRI